MNTQQLTIENFTEQTGFRFRASKEQAAQIKSGTLTREQAFSDFLNNGGLQRLQSKNQSNIPNEIYFQDGLTLENFGERTKALTGTARRFRVSTDQAQRIDAGLLSREQALAETIAAKRSTVGV